MLTKTEKTKIIKKYSSHKDDTGSPSVQIAILTEEIIKLTEHLKVNKKDVHSRRGLLKKVAERRKHMEYLKRTDEELYEKIIKKLKIKSI